MYTRDSYFSNEQQRLTMNTSSVEIDLDAITQPLLEQCSHCSTLYKFSVSREQQERYYAEPRIEPIQNIFPELPIPARAVLSQGNVCALCTSPSKATADALKPFAFHFDRSVLIHRGNPVMLVKERYIINGRPALAIYDEETLTAITVNIPEIELNADEVLIRKEGDRAGLRAELIEACAIVDEGRPAGPAYPNLYVCKLAS